MFRVVRASVTVKPSSTSVGAQETGTDGTVAVALVVFGVLVFVSLLFLFSRGRLRRVPVFRPFFCRAVFVPLFSRRVCMTFLFVFSL